MVSLLAHPVEVSKQVSSCPKKQSKTGLIAHVTVNLPALTKVRLSLIKSEIPHTPLCE